MRYVVFPSFNFKTDLIPNIEDLIDKDIIILCGPSESGLYFIEGPEEAISLLKEIVYPYYLFMEDFDKPTLN